MPIVPDYLYNLQQTPITTEDTFKFLAKNCSKNELLKKQNYFFRHPVQFRRVLKTYCNWTVDWAMNKTEYENKQRTVILEQVGLMIMIENENIDYLQGKSMDWNHVRIESICSIINKSICRTVNKSVKDNERNSRFYFLILVLVIVYQCFPDLLL